MTEREEREKREAFEKWFDPAGKWPQSLERDGHGGYRFAVAVSAWAAFQGGWQARASQPAAAVPPLIAVDNGQPKVRFVEMVPAAWMRTFPDGDRVLSFTHDVDEYPNWNWHPLYYGVSIAAPHLPTIAAAASPKEPE